MKLSHKSIYTIDRLRPTALQLFEECPASYCAKTLSKDGIPEKQNRYARAGTAAHRCVELTVQTLTDKPPTEEDWKKAEKELNSASLSGDETDNTVAYCNKINELIKSGYQIVAQEHLFRIQMFEGMPPVSGTIDLILLAPDGYLLIVDHKTNRQGEAVDDWRWRLQPLLYAWACRKLWNGFKGVKFQLGYINLGYDLIWETSPDDDQWTERRVWEIWNKMVSYSSSGEWPVQFNKLCGFCPVKDVCPAYKTHITEFNSNFLQSMDTDAVAVKYEKLKLIRKLAATAEEELEQQLIDQIKASGGKLKIGQLEYSLSYSSRRKVDYEKYTELLFRSFDAGLINESELVKANSVYEIGLGKFDKIVKELPQLKKELEATVEKVTGTNPSVNVTTLKAIEQ